MADPTALQTAVAAAQAVQLIGMPEGRIILAQAVTHLATAPKSNASYTAVNEAIADVRAGHTGAVPAHLRDAHYPGAAALGHGQGYVYSHDEPHAVARQQYAPDPWSGGTITGPSPSDTRSGSPSRWPRCAGSSAATERAPGRGGRLGRPRGIKTPGSPVVQG